ncbi:MAG TPA: sigma-70 family RNA polymerase sigma factor [Thermoanaerobaculia bacterium]|nr:sigma-70 family RNA polymerase sigma factor [Thermoanaerobaculia bacterium]
MTTGTRAPAGPDGPGAAEAIRAGEPQVLSAVVETYLPRMLRAARGAGLRPEEADEVVQETFTTFLEVAHRFEGRSRVRTFLFGILYRKISEARRGRARDRRHDPIDDVMESRFKADGSWSRPPEASDRLLRTHELRRFLSDCLEESPASQRMAFHLREVEGLSTEEICKILDVTTTNLGVMLYRLRNRTRECLETRDVEA